MKKSIAVMALLFAGMSAQAAERNLVANLTKFDIDPKAFSSVGNIVSGQVSLHLSKSEKTANLMLNRNNGCAPGRLCMAMVPAPFMIELPIVSMERDGCGSVKYVAMKDERPVDGVLQTLEIIDNSKNKCQHFILEADTVVHYLTDGHVRGVGELKTSSQFQGNSFKEELN